MAGELTDATAIKTAAHDADAALSVLGPSSTRVPGTPITNAMVTVISAMKAHGVRRLVASATLSLSDPGDAPPWTVRAMVTGVRLFAPRPYLDIVGTGEAIKGSGLEWRLVPQPGGRRQGGLTDPGLYAEGLSAGGTNGEGVINATSLSNLGLVLPPVG